MNSLKLVEIKFPEDPLQVNSETQPTSFAFDVTMVDVLESETEFGRKITFRVSNRGIIKQPLKICFKTDKKLAYVPTWLHNPPVYDLNKRVKFTHFGLPSRVGMKEGLPADLPFAICMNPGKNPDCIMIACETVDKGVGIELEDGGVSFRFLDGTEQSSWEIEFYEVRGKGLINCMENYHRAVPYKGIKQVKSKDENMMWFFDSELHYGTDDDQFDLELFKNDARKMADMGTKYAVMEMRHYGQHFDARYWAPKNADHIPGVDFFIKALDILTDLGIEPLMYYNCVHGVMSLITHPDYGNPDLYRMRFKPADGGLAQRKMEKAMKVDMNWFKDGVVPVHEYPIDSDPVLDVRCAEWRDWLCRRITFMLKTYPQLKGTYIDTWPAGLPFFGESLNDYDKCYDENSWWNAMDDFMWEIRQATHFFKDKIFMLNDSRMSNKVMESADLILNEDAGPIANPERAFWHCLRSMAVGHGSKSSYQFHHAKPGMRNDDRAELVMACAAAMELGYCIIHFDFSHKEDQSDNNDAYDTAVDSMKWIINKENRIGDPEVTISEKSNNIEALSFQTDKHNISIDFPENNLKITDVS